MALNKDQVRKLEKIPGIDQTLLGTYKANNPGSRPQDSVNAPAVTDDFGVSRITNFNVALNTAIGKAREQRKDSVLDFVGGMIPAGTLPATSFASVLNAFNASSAPIEASLLNNASDFALEAERQKTQIQGEIKDLALATVKAGGSPETMASVMAFLESGDITGAMKVAAASLSISDPEIKEVDNQLVRVNKDGTVDVIFSGANRGGGSGTSTAARKIEVERALRSRWGTDPGEEYANSQDYWDLYNEWVSEGKSSRDFLSTFNPDRYLNPNDPTINPELRREMDGAEKGAAKFPPRPGDPGYEEYVRTGEY